MPCVRSILLRWHSPTAIFSSGLNESPMMTRYAMQEPHRYSSITRDSAASNWAQSEDHGLGPTPHIMDAQMQETTC